MRPKLNFFLRYVVPIIGYMALIFYVSSLPNIGPGSGIDLSVLHIPEYFILAWLLYRMLHAAQCNISRDSMFMFSIIFTVTYGIFDEFHQSFVPGRVFSLLDMAYNALGSMSIILFS